MAHINKCITDLLSKSKSPFFLHFSLPFFLLIFHLFFLCFHSPFICSLLSIFTPSFLACFPFIPFSLPHFHFIFSFLPFFPSRAFFLSFYHQCLHSFLQYILPFHSSISSFSFFPFNLSISFFPTFISLPFFLSTLLITLKFSVFLCLSW